MVGVIAEVSAGFGDVLNRGSASRLPANGWAEGYQHGNWWAAGFLQPQQANSAAAGMKGSASRHGEVRASGCMSDTLRSRQIVAVRAGSGTACLLIADRDNGHTGTEMGPANQPDRP
ncbi:hypothetical protein D3C78_1203750 [compost metagenome]